MLAADPLSRLSLSDREQRAVRREFLAELERAAEREAEWLQCAARQRAEQLPAAVEVAQIVAAWERGDDSLHGMPRIAR